MADEPKKKSKKADDAAESKAPKAKAEKAPKAEKAEKAAAPKAAKAGKGDKAGEGDAKAAKATKAKAKAPAAATAPKAGKAKAAKAGPVKGKSARAHARYVRMAPRKLRLVMDAIRGKSVKEARGILQFCGKRAAGPLAKVLNSAVANAENNHHMDTEALYIATAFVDQGPSLKSFIPRARGRASAIHKFMSHILIEVKEREER
jgi:large subunit ribosomal protein L22